MNRRHKIALLIFFAVCGLLGYGVYWWHEASLDRIAQAHIRYSGPELTEVRQLLAEDKPAEARAAMDLYDESVKIGVLRVLCTDTASSVRMFAVRYMREMRDIPVIRTELARIAVQDGDASVSRVAERALQGRR